MPGQEPVGAWCPATSAPAVVDGLDVGGDDPLAGRLGPEGTLHRPGMRRGRVGCGNLDDVQLGEAVPDLQVEQRDVRGPAGQGHAQRDGALERRRWQRLAIAQRRRVDIAVGLATRATPQAPVIGRR